MEEEKRRSEKRGGFMEGEMREEKERNGARKVGKGWLRGYSVERGEMDRKG